METAMNYLPQKTVDIYTADVTHLKGRRHAICYLFERDRQSPRIN